MKSIIGLLVCASLFASCKSTPSEPEGFKVERIKHDHDHTRYCGHFLRNDTWYYAPQHRHKEGCPHTLENGVWTYSK